MPDLNLNHFISIEKFPLPSPFKLLELTFLKGCSWKVFWEIGVTGAMLAEFAFVVLWYCGQIKVCTLRSLP